MRRAHLMYWAHIMAFRLSVRAIHWLELAKLRHCRRADFWGTLEIARRAAWRKP